MKTIVYIKIITQFYFYNNIIKWYLLYNLFSLSLSAKNSQKIMIFNSKLELQSTHINSCVWLSLLVFKTRVDVSEFRIIDYK